MAIKKFLCLLIPELSNKYFLFVGFLLGSLLRKSIPGILSDYVFKLNTNKIINKNSDDNDNKNVKDYKLFDQEKEAKFFDIVCNILSDLLTGIIHYFLIKKENYSCEKINNYNNKNNENNEFIEKKTNRRISFIFNDETIKTKLLYQIIFMISIIDFTCQLCFYFGCHANKDKIIIGKSYNIDYFYSFLVIDIVARYIFSRLILKTYFYYHHYLSFILNIIALLILFVVDGLSKIKKYQSLFLIVFFVQYILYSLEDILNKVALIKLFIYPESILFYKGVFSLVYFFIFVAFLLLSGDLHIEINFNKELFFRILIKIIFIIFNIIRSIFLVKVIDIFTSQHISFLKVLETIILFGYYYIDRFFKGKNEISSNYFPENDLVDLVEINAFLILLISALIHNEIIIINSTKLKKNTKYFLSIEAELEKYGLLSRNTDYSNTG